jgi:hypothetical protein
MYIHVVLPRSICTKFDTNLLHTNLLHSMSRKNWTRDTNCSTVGFAKKGYGSNFNSYAVSTERKTKTV